MAINFPSNPNVNDTHTVGSTVWTWNGSSWNGVSHDPIEIATLTYPSVDGTNGQVLQTDGSGNLSFGDAPAPSLTLADLPSIAIDNLSDVDTTTSAPTDGQALVWDNATSLWKPSTVSSGGGSGAFSTTYSQVQIETSTPSTESLNELWFNPNTANWSKTVAGAEAGLQNTQVASITGGQGFGSVSVSNGTISFPYGTVTPTITFTTPLWLVSYSHPSFDGVSIESFVLEDDTVITAGGTSYNNSGTEWANQRVKSLTFTSGFRSNNTSGTLNVMGAPVWQELEKTFTNPMTISGVIEKITPLSGATGTVEHDTSSSHIFRHSSIPADFTANFTNMSISTNQVNAVTLILDQGATAYIPNAVEIGGSSQTIKWQGGSAPTGTASGTDTVTFSIMNSGGTYTVIGHLASYS